MGDPKTLRKSNNGKTPIIFKEQMYFIMMCRFFLLLVFAVKSVYAGTYTIDIGGAGSVGTYSGFSIPLNQPPYLNQALGPGTLRFVAQPNYSFILNSNGNAFQIVNFLRIDNSGPNWTVGPTIASSYTGFTPSTSTGVVSISEILSSGIDLKKTISSNIEVRLVDNYWANNSLTPGQSYTVETKFIVGPQNTSSFNSFAMNYEVSNISSLSQSNPVILAGFRIEDLTGNSVKYLSVIPEPSALSLLAVGLGGLAMMRRRRS